MSPLFDLSGRVVLLTGSTGHLGSAIARGLCDAGAIVILNSRSMQRVSAQAAALAGAGGRVDSAVFDITERQQRLRAIASIGRKHRRLDVIINNANEPQSGQGHEAFQRVYEVAVTGAWELVRESLKWLEIGAKRNPGGASIINICSMYGVVSPDLRIYSKRTPPNPPYYGPAKAGLLQLTRYLACELGTKKIRVNAISPGPFPASKVTRADPAFAGRLAQKNPLGRIGQPDELIGPVLFLASDASSYVTGANLKVDGGWTAW